MVGRFFLKKVVPGVAGAMLALVMVVPMLNVQRLAEHQGWDVFLRELVSGNLWPLISWANSIEARAIAACLVSFSVGLWAERVLRKKERPEQEKKEKMRVALSKIKASLSIRPRKDNLHYYIEEINSGAYLFESEIDTLKLISNLVNGYAVIEHKGRASGISERHKGEMVTRCIEYADTLLTHLNSKRRKREEACAGVNERYPGVPEIRYDRRIQL